MVARVFISKQKEGEESKEAERQRESVCVCVRECKHWGTAAVASVVNRPLENTYVEINKIVGICVDCH
jgi:hypothetical protein